MTLLDKLKPEYRKLFEKNNVQYPYITERIISCLESEEFVGNIPYSIWIDIKFFTNVYSLYDLFKDI